MSVINQLAGINGVDERLFKKAIKEVVDESGGGGGLTKAEADGYYKPIDYEPDLSEYEKTTDNDSKLALKQDVLTAFKQTEADLLYKPIGYQPDPSIYETVINNNGKLALKQPLNKSASLYGFSRYNWSGTQTVNNGSSLNLLTLSGLEASKTGNIVLPPITGGILKLLPPTEVSGYQNIVINLRINGTSGGQANTVRQFFFELRRSDGTTVIERLPLLKVIDNAIVRRGLTFESYTFTTTDPFIVNGFTLFLVNNSGTEITLSNNQSDPAFTLTIKHS